VPAREIAAEVIKCATAAEKFTGEKVQLHFPIVKKSGLKITTLDCASTVCNEVFVRTAAVILNPTT
jgi:hypothetical protein